MFCTKCGDKNDKDVKFCKKCGEETRKEKIDTLDKEQKKASKESVEVKKEMSASIVLGLGIFSVFLGGEIGLLPVVTIGVGIYAISKTKNEDSGRWKAVVGLILGLIYFFVYLVNYGHINIDQNSKSSINNYNSQNSTITLSPSHSPTTENDNLEKLDNIQENIKTASPQCRNDKLGYESCHEYSSHKFCLSLWDYEYSCEEVPTEETSQCRNQRLGYESCKEGSSHIFCLSLWDYEYECGDTPINESKKCRNDRLGYLSCAESSSQTFCLSLWDYETSCN